MLSQCVYRGPCSRSPSFSISTTRFTEDPDDNMAMVIIVAMLINRAVIVRGGHEKVMKNPEKPQKSPELERERRAESLLAEIFEQAGWRVEQPQRQRSPLDMIVRGPEGVVYAVEVKAAVEGRGDRLVPLFSQA